MSRPATEQPCPETHVPRLRPRVLWAIARRDILRVRGGQQHRGRLRSIGVAGLLLGAAALVPGPGGPPEAGAPTVPAVVGVGALPPALDGKVRAVPQSPVTLHTMDGQPVRVVARGVGPRLRAALDELPGPTVRREVVGQAPEAPPFLRNLLIVLIAASLLTGPLAESLPGERAQHTWETLRAASVRTAEICAGKWLAWTGAALAGTGMALLVGIVRGSITLDVALLGLPLALGQTVALGLWLVAPSTDQAGAATVPVRVIPLAVVFAGVAAWMLAPSGVAGLVPLGGALLLAAGGEADLLLPGALVSTALTCGALLFGAARRCENSSAAGVSVLPAVPAIVGAAGAWMLGGWGAGRLGGSVALATVAAAGVLWLTVALMHLRRPRGSWHPRPAGVAGGVVGGLLLGALFTWAPPGPTLLPATDILHNAPLWAVLALVVGQEVLFRGLLLGPLRGPGAGARQATSGMLWLAMAGTAAPIHALGMVILLTALRRRGGLEAAIAARVTLCAMGTL